MAKSPSSKSSFWRLVSSYTGPYSSSRHSSSYSTSRQSQCHCSSSQRRCSFLDRYGKKSMLWYIMVCSMIGGISVSVTTGLGSAIVTTAQGDNQVRYHLPVIRIISDILLVQALVHIFPYGIYRSNTRCVFDQVTIPVH